MPPEIALILCIVFILYLFKFDSRRDSNVSHAVWIPLIWVIIIGSRPVARWLNVGPVSESEMDIMTGNPIDRTIFIILIVAGLLILSRRMIHSLHILKSNMLVIFLFTYCGVSILWSDFPFVSFKRWMKEVGNLIMVLVILTDADPREAVKAVIRRCAYVLIPLSVVLIKYYVDFGRIFTPWGGSEFVGVSTSKNMLGNLCLVCGLFFFWGAFVMRGKKKEPFDRKEAFVNFLFLGLIFWLLIKIDSATSLMCSIIGGFFLLVMGLPFLKRNAKSIGVFFFTIIVVFMVLQWVFDIGQVLISSLERDVTLTGRIALWNEVLGMVRNPLFGTGYESFWLGDRLAQLWRNHWWRPNQAHNGYIEIYLNLGLIGLLLLAGVVLSSYRNIRRTLMVDFDYGRWQMAFLAIALIINVTEGVFKGTSIIWFVFLLIAMDVSRILQHSGPKDDLCVQ